MNALVENCAFSLISLKTIALLVARTGFEPVVSALRGRRPKPLDERACVIIYLTKITISAFMHNCRFE
jgi:hypothetical protein